MGASGEIVSECYTGGLYYGLGATVRGIPTEDIRDNAVTSRKIADNTIMLEDLSDELRRLQGIPGPQGPAGPQGAQGATGNTGPQGQPGITPSISAGAGLHANLVGTTWNIGIANQGVTTDLIADAAVTSEKIANGNVSLSKLKMGELGAWIETDLYVRWRKNSFIPVFWGRPTGDTSPVNWWLQDFATSWSSQYYYIWNVKWDLIGQKTWRDLNVTGISNSGYGFFLAYNVENGHIGLVVKGDLSIDDAAPPENYALYDIQDYPERDNVFSNPSEFVFDLGMRTVRRRVDGR